ncbi:MAG: type II toxin-antitoxin system RelE/ParE family toxin [Patescibacteria group bacterium]
MICSFRDRETEKIWHQEYSREFPPALQRIALRKLFMIHRAKLLKDLMIPPGNRLEMLQGKRKGVYSIRVNDQFRICFVWKDNNAFFVEITDYH